MTDEADGPTIAEVMRRCAVLELALEVVIAALSEEQIERLERRIESLGDGTDPLIAANEADQATIDCAVELLTADRWSGGL